MAPFTDGTVQISLCRKMAESLKSLPRLRRAYGLGEKSLLSGGRPQSKPVLLSTHLLARAVLPYRGICVLLFILAGRASIVIRLIVFQRLSRIYLGPKPVRLVRVSTSGGLSFTFVVFEADEFVVFVIVMSPPPLASFFGLRSPGLTCFLIVSLIFS